MPSVIDRSDTARPTFFMDAIQNTAKSEQAGRPIFEDKEMCRVVTPGDKHISWVFEVERHKDEVMARWPKEYEAFKRNEQVAQTGTPLEMWPNPSLTKARVAELKGLHIHSVEDLSIVTDSNLPKLGMKGRELREQARTYLERAKDGVNDSAMAAEIAQLREMVERLQASQSAPVSPVEPKEKTLEDCTDQELKDFIKRETGDGVRGTPTRETLMKKAADIANAKAEAA